MFGVSKDSPDILFRELVDNTVDICLKNKVSFNIVARTGVAANWVIDTGVGHPLYTDKDSSYGEGKSIIYDLLTQINVGSNFHKTTYALGQNGIGSKLTNSLSSVFHLVVNLSKKRELGAEVANHIDVSQDVYIITFRNGIFDLEQSISRSELCSILPDDMIKDLPDNFGSAIYFEPNADFFDTTKIEYHAYPFKLFDHLKKFDTYKDIQLNFNLNGEQIKPFNFKEEFKGDLVGDYIQEVIFEYPTEEEVPVLSITQLAYSLNKFNCERTGSVNFLQTHTGKHIYNFTRALAHAMAKLDNTITAEDVKLGMRLFNLTLAVEPSFNSQDKTSLGRIEDKGFTDKSFIKALGEQLYANYMRNGSLSHKFFQTVVQRIIEYKKRTGSLKNLDLIKSTFIMGDESDVKRSISGASTKVYECTGKVRSECELFISEGLSASSSIISTKNGSTQAILPLRGKMLNTSEIPLAKLTLNKEVVGIINTIGAGIGPICDPSKSRYGKLIIATDEDFDGKHITNLITALFVTHAPEIIKAGLLYKLITPYYRVTSGKTTEYFYNDEKDKVDFSKSVAKLKGLGSLTKEETVKYIISKDTRKIEKVEWDFDKSQDEVDECMSVLYSAESRTNLMIARGVFSQSIRAHNRK
jgi:DNA gyrase/topoisomerase IV subunit B